MQTALDAGINWIDTAEIYGRGKSEELVGRAVKGRDDALVFTKVAPEPGGSGFRPDQVRVGVEASLRRLGREAIDLYQLHWPAEPSIEIEETWGAMAALVDTGKVRFIGVSNFTEDLIEGCEKVRHVDSLQPQFSMLWQEGREDLLPFCGENGTGIICYGPLAYGLLSGVMTKETTFTEDDWRGGGTRMGYYEHLFAPGVFEKQIDKVDSLRPIADRLGTTVAQLALAWVVHQRGVTGAIAGSRSPEHVEENAGAGSVDLEQKDLDEIDTLLGKHGDN
jgi:aryl-alcohol dehydrogenase-like predicted oxidoreductase